MYSALRSKSGDVPIRDLQKELLRQGAYLGSKESLKDLSLA